MAARNRNITVLFSLIASMTLGALVLMALDHHAPTAGAYSLSSYLRLDPVDEVIKNTLMVQPAQWTSIQVTYSKTSGGNSQDLALLTGLAGAGQAQFHFVVCNGVGGDDGQVQAGDFWKTQQSCRDNSGVIRIYVVSLESADTISDSQLQRTNTLVESLSRTFEISPRKIHYPADWRM